MTLKVYVMLHCGLDIYCNNLLTIIVLGKLYKKMSWLTTIGECNVIATRYFSNKFYQSMGHKKTDASMYTSVFLIITDLIKNFILNLSTYKTPIAYNMLQNQESILFT